MTDMASNLVKNQKFRVWHRTDRTAPHQPSGTHARTAQHSTAQHMQLHAQHSTAQHSTAHAIACTATARKRIQETSKII